MTRLEIERLAVLEQQYYALQKDVSEIKLDIKSLIATSVESQLDRNRLVGLLEVNDALDRRSAQTRGTIGVWVRAALPWVLAFLALLLSLHNAILN